MKKIIISIATLLAIQSNAQVTTNGGLFNRWMGLTFTTGAPAIRSIGFGGDFAGTGLSPQSRLQVNDFNWQYPANGAVTVGSLFRTDGNNANLNQWQFFTGNTGLTTTEKYKLYIPAGSSNVGQQSTRGDMFFNTTSANGASGGVAERMRLSQGLGGNLTGGWNTTAGVTKVQISHDGFGASYLPPAVAMLNIGTSVPGPSGGNRNWMDVGTYYAMNTENMYIGLKDAGGMNNTNAIINWGDDAVQPNTNNRLLFNFTGFPGQGKSSTIDGLEVARMWASANAGRMGIGGDPTINQYFPIPSDPNNTLEINSPVATFVPNTVGTSGLRFTDLRSTSTPQANPGTGLLSVDANGDVILVPGGGIANANNGISVNAGVIQLGVPCTLPGGFPNIPGILASQLTEDRVVANRNFNFWIASLDTETGGVGIGGQPVLPFCGTGNTFEISANSKNPQYPIAGGASGMRFTKLISTSPTIPNGTFGVNSAKVLTVDGDGDVVLTDAFTGSTLGNLCGATQNPLTNNYEVPMAGFNFNYTTPANTQASFHFGNTACLPTLGRMNVYNDNLQVTSVVSSNVSLATNAIGLFSDVSNTGSGNSLSIQGTANTFGAGATARGVRGEAIAASGLLAEGVKGIANSSNNCQQNIAVGGLAANGIIASIAGDFDVENSNSNFNQGINVEIKLGTNASATNFGINTGVNTPGSVNYGGLFVAAGATTNYGVYGQAPHSGGTNGPNYAGYFDGDLVYTGTFGMASDASLKTNIDTLQDAISIINQLKPKQFNFDQAGHPSMSFPGGLQYGLIAQDVETVLPNLVNNNVHPAKLDSIGNVLVPPVNFKSVEYEQLIPFLIKGMQQQQAQIKKQDSLITALSNQINSCCSSATTRNNNSNLNQLDIELSDKDAIVLNQNVPNPFAEQTTITYNVPASVGKAQLIFFNTNGQVIQTVDIKTRGKGKVNVFASDLTSGLYNYTLVADGKVIDSKKMVRE